MKVILRGLGALSIIVVLLIAAALGYRAYQQAEIRSAIRIDTPNGIQSQEQVMLNGLEQSIKIRGHDTDNPIFLHLHGGPGMPEMAVSHISNLKLEKHFTVVHWDQRGSGKTRRQGVRDEDLTISVFLDDTIALVRYLRERFGKDKIYLLGHSWGSMLGVMAVRQHPEFFHAYVGMGQVTNLYLNEEISLDYVIRAAKMDRNTEALDALAQLNPPYLEDPNQLTVQRRWLYHYGGGFRGIGYKELFLAYFTSPDYSLLDLAAAAVGTTISQPMWPEMGRHDFLQEANVLEVPVYFFAGRYDYNTPSVLARSYYESLRAPSKAFFWFENSAHMMHFSDPQRYQALLIREVLQVED